MTSVQTKGCGVLNEGVPADLDSGFQERNSERLTRIFQNDIVTMILEVELDCEPTL